MKLEDNRVQPVLEEIEGNDLSFLIGRKAETIIALQYYFRVDRLDSREVGRWIPLQIDVQHYRRRREEEFANWPVECRAGCQHGP